MTWVEEVLRELPAGGRLLDAGAGERRFEKACSHLRYVSQDLSQYDGAGDGRGLQTGTWAVDGVDIKSDITRIPEPDASFDAVLCTEVMEHIPEPLAALREFARLLRPGGQLILTAPFCSLTHFAPYHFCTGFNRYYYERHLPDVGFSILEISSNGGYFDYLAQEMERCPEMASRYSSTLTWWQLRVLGVWWRVLQALANADRGSCELLCFGYHVRASRTPGVR